MSSIVNMRKPRRANAVVEANGRRSSKPLFDEFWREGELAMLFGEPGVGKSVLGVQIANELAEAGSLAAHGEVQKQRSRAKGCGQVLYVDLVLSDRQFAARYSGVKFAEDLYREVPESGQDLFEWVRAMVVDCGFKAVVIDDLSMVSRTEDGTRDTLELMRSLRQLTVETGVSILVIADSYPFVFEKRSPERALRRSRVLAGVADTVFALQRAGNKEQRLELVQTRSRVGELVWTVKRPLECSIEALEGGMLGLEFDTSERDEERREQILEIKELHDEDRMTFRDIAAELGISKSQAQRLYSEWRPGLEPRDADAADTEVEDPLADLDPRYLSAARPDDDIEYAEPNVSPEGSPPSEPDKTADPPGFPECLERSLDGWGKEIFVEKWDDDEVRPAVWYKRSSTGYHRHQRGRSGIAVEHITESMAVLP